MTQLKALLESNKAWAAKMRAEDPEFFKKLSRQQAPEYLWIGCSDSRVPANQVTGLAPGEVFVHRNIANVMSHGDLNCLSVMQFAVDILKVKHIIVCGHYGCGGVHAALTGTRVGLADNWLRHVGDVAIKHSVLCELNVIEQVINVCQTTVVQDAWARGQPLSVHGWIYGLLDGRIRELGFGVDAPEDAAAAYNAAIEAIRAGQTAP
jgi:carbonic anhydrase